MAEQELARLVGQPTLVLDFEGPLDLLLHLIKGRSRHLRHSNRQDYQLSTLNFCTNRSKPVCIIEYFVWRSSYVNQGDAITEPPVVEDELPPIEDPRAELVAQLLEYQRYKGSGLAPRIRKITGSGEHQKSNGGAKEPGRELHFARGWQLKSYNGPSKVKAPLNTTTNRFPNRRSQTR